MTVLERLNALREPIFVEEWEWGPLAGRDIPGFGWRPSRVGGYKAVLLRRIDAAAKGWSVRHLWRFMQMGARRKFVEALKFQTPEAQWFAEMRR